MCWEQQGQKSAKVYLNTADIQLTHEYMCSITFLNMKKTLQTSV